MSGEIPQSTALAEATPDSLAVLFSRDPEGLSSQDRTRIIESFREQRARVESAERAAPGKTQRGAGKVALSDTSKVPIEDMGL